MRALQEALIKRRWIDAELAYLDTWAPRILLVCSLYLLLNIPLDLSHNLNSSPTWGFVSTVRVLACALCLGGAFFASRLKREDTLSEVRFKKSVYAVISGCIVFLQYVYKSRHPDSLAELYAGFIAALAVRMFRLGGWHFAFLLGVQAVGVVYVTAPLLAYNFLSFQLFATLFSYIFIVQMRVENRRFAESTALSLQLEDLTREQGETVRRQSRELASAQVAAALGRAVQMLAHDVRSPLSRVRALIEAVRATSSGVEKARLVEESLPDIDRSLTAANAMVADVMDISGERSVALEPHEPAEILSQAWSDACAQCAHVTAQLTFDARHEGMLDADAARLHRAFVNVFVNALQASGAEASVEVKTWQESPAQLGLSIANMGSFIEEHARGRIFDLFFTSGKAQGTGLGLAIVKKAVELHGGTVECRAEKSARAPLGRVEFVFRLPAHARRSSCHKWPARLPDVAHSPPSPPLDAAPEREEKAEAPRARIAFLDDSVTFRTAWKAFLQRAAEVDVFSHPRAFWAEVDAHPALLSEYALVITDLHFGSADENLGLGLRFAEELRERGHRRPIVLCTNDGSVALEPGGPVDAVIDKKPMDVPALLKSLRGAR